MPRGPSAEPLGGPSGGRVLEVGALSARPRRAELKRFRVAFAASHPWIATPAPAARRVILGVGAAAGVLGVLTLAFGFSETVAEGGDDVVGQSAGIAAVGLLMLIGLVVLVWATVRTARRKQTPLRHWRLARFAAENGLTYIPGPVPGVLTAWRERGLLTIARAVRARTPDGRLVEWADYELRQGNATSSSTQFGGWIAVALRRPLPHIVLRSTARGSRALSTAAVPDASQRLSLEGDFDRHFTLYCPRGYERDALYLFTPDVMARAIDAAGGWDIEIVDDRLLMVRSRDVVTTDARSWVEVVAAANAFAGKVQQWERWREERVDPVGDGGTGIEVAGVAPAGRRLRTSLSPATWVWLGITVVVLAAVVVAGLL